MSAKAIYEREANEAIHRLLQSGGNDNDLDDLIEALVRLDRYGTVSIQVTGRRPSTEEPST